MLIVRAISLWLLAVVYLVTSVVLGFLIMAVLYFLFVHITDPLDVDEAAGPQFARGMIGFAWGILGAFVGMFVGGLTMSPVWSKVKNFPKRLKILTGTRS
ncbi:MAG: hypothetical protein K2P80_15595 [Beijerinckiaceae bacterium]|nr:hypothetical protein [Beijerinckiaceae bacterium]